MGHAGGWSLLFTWLQALIEANGLDPEIFPYPDDFMTTTGEQWMDLVRQELALVNQPLPAPPPPPPPRVTGIRRRPIHLSPALPPPPPPRETGIRRRPIHPPPGG